MSKNKDSFGIHLLFLIIKTIPVIIFLVVSLLGADYIIENPGWFIYQCMFLELKHLLTPIKFSNSEGNKKEECSLHCYLEMFPQLELKIFVGSCFEMSILYYPISNFPNQPHPNPSPLRSSFPERLTISMASVGGWGWNMEITQYLP